MTHVVVYDCGEQHKFEVRCGLESDLHHSQVFVLASS